MDQDFLKNDIYKYLKKKNSSTLVGIIEDTYKHCENILGTIPKEFSNYTIHDIHHAIRVINYMTEFVKPNLKKHSDFHLALIILVGLLHDTGMSVSNDEKKEILAKYIQGNGTDNEQELFQDYIRERHSKRVKWILDTYIVDKKSKSVLSSLYRLDSYNFSDEIALICQSHTESIEWIKENIKTYDILTDYEYNPQQIAFLLKLGDNLDIDARRAPYSLLNLLKIKGYSETEWEKHSPITNYDKVKFSDDCFHIFFNGKSDDAFIYRKTMEHILWLENTCNEISIIVATYNPPYKFNLDKTIKTEIEPIGFEATDLHFSLDYSSVLKLLMGEQIYGDKKYGLRELLQNSIDAVLVMKEKLSNKATSNYQPTIWIEMNKKKNTISICDNGTGMTTHILENYFFNIGKSYYSSNEYKNLNLNYSTIGHFGIGFLACFMLSSSVLLETQAIGSKPIVIEFERMSQFVTKFKDANCEFEEGHGTRIHLSYNEIIPDVFPNEKELLKYVKALLLVEDYNISILSSDNKITKIQNPTQNFKRHVRTDLFDLYYTYYGKIEFWDNILPIWDGYDDVFFYLEDHTSGLRRIPPMVVDLREVYRVLDKVELDKCDDESSAKLALMQALACDASANTKTFFTACSEKYPTIKDLKKNLSKALYRNGTYENRPFFSSIEYLDLTSPFGIKRTLALIGYADRDFRRHGMHGHELDLRDLYRSFPKHMQVISFSEYGHTSDYIYPTADYEGYLPLSSQYYISAGTIYKDGILVSNEAINISPAPTGSRYDRLIMRVNVLSDEFALTVSRNSFISEDSRKLNKSIMSALFNDLVNDPERYLTDVEKERILRIIESHGILNR